MGTYKGFFSGVDAQVCSQKARACKCMSTALPGTDKGFFFGVDAQVFCQMARACKRMPTTLPGTDKELCAAPGSRMPCQVGAVMEAGAAMATRADTRGGCLWPGAGDSSPWRGCHRQGPGTRSRCGSVLHSLVQ